MRANFELNQIRSAKRSSLGSVSRTQTRFHGDITNRSFRTVHYSRGYKAASSYREHTRDRREEGTTKEKKGDNTSAVEGRRDENWRGINY